MTKYRVRKWQDRWAYWSQPWHADLGLPPDDALPTWAEAFGYAHAFATADQLIDRMGLT